VKVLCGSCYDAKCAHGKLEAQMKGAGLRVEAIDGRAFGRSKTAQPPNRTKG
jgi:hypothetical protein